MNMLLKCNCKLSYVMRDMIPLPGAEFRKLIMVQLEAGEYVAEHSHKGHAALYYPMDSSSICFEPRAGTVIYLPPGTKHSVPPVDVDRISFAMIVDE